MAFKMLNKELFLIERYTISWKHPISSKEDDWYRQPLSETCFKYAKTGHWVKTRPSLQLLPRPYQGSGQAGDDCSALPRQGWSVLQVPTP